MLRSLVGSEMCIRDSLDVQCIDDRNNWLLTLGEGTGRTDEVVIDTIGPIPFAAPAVEQEASWRIEETAAFGAPTVINQRDFQVASLGSPGTGGDGVDDVLRSGGGGALGLSIILLAGARRRFINGAS